MGPLFLCSQVLLQPLGGSKTPAPAMLHTKSFPRLLPLASCSQVQPGAGNPPPWSSPAAPDWRSPHTFQEEVPHQCSFPERGPRWSWAMTSGFEITSMILTSCQTHLVQFIAMFCNHKLFRLAALAAQTRWSWESGGAGRLPFPPCQRRLGGWAGIGHTRLHECRCTCRPARSLGTRNEGTHRMSGAGRHWAWSRPCQNPPV